MRINSIVQIEGLHAIKHAWRFGAKFTQVKITDLGLQLASSIAAKELNALQEQGVVQVVNTGALQALTNRNLPTECIGFALRPSQKITPLDSPTIALQNPKNLHNVGSIIRTIAAFNLNVAITDSDIDLFHPVITRTSAGLNFAVNYNKINDVENLPRPIYAIDNAQRGQDISTHDFSSRPSTYLFGSERTGLADSARSQADKSIEIPISNQVSSLSLPHCVAIVASRIGLA